MYNKVDRKETSQGLTTMLEWTSWFVVRKCAIESRMWRISPKQTFNWLWHSSLDCWVWGNDILLMSMAPKYVFYRQPCAILHVECMPEDFPGSSMSHGATSSASIFEHVLNTRRWYQDSRGRLVMASKMSGNIITTNADRAATSNN